MHVCIVVVISTLRVCVCVIRLGQFQVFVIFFRRETSFD
jgi:hypothetical protein